VDGSVQCRGGGLSGKNGDDNYRMATTAGSQRRGSLTLQWPLTRHSLRLLRGSGSSPMDSWTSKHLALVSVDPSIPLEPVSNQAFLSLSPRNRVVGVRRHSRPFDTRSWHKTLQRWGTSPSCLPSRARLSIRRPPISAIIPPVRFTRTPA
jgi:hypothetical protein